MWIWALHLAVPLLSTLSFLLPHTQEHWAVLSTKAAENGIFFLTESQYWHILHCIQWWYYFGTDGRRILYLHNLLLHSLLYCLVTWRDICSYSKAASVLIRNGHEEALAMYEKDKTAEGKVARCGSFTIVFKGGIGPTEVIFWIAAAVLVADSRTGNEPRLNSSPKNCDFFVAAGIGFADPQKWFHGPHGAHGRWFENHFCKVVLFLFHI